MYYLFMSQINVRKENDIIIAEYQGKLDHDTLEEAQQQIKKHLGSSSRRILHDTRNLKTPDMELAKKMEEFTQKEGRYIQKTATVTSDASIAFKARIAFEEAADHKVFYDDLEAARSWLIN